MKCDFGCGRESSFVLKNGKQCCERHFNSCPNMIEINRQGLKNAWALGKLDSPKRKGHISHWKGVHKIHNSDILKYPSEYDGELVKQRYIQTREYYCDICGINEWQNKKLILDLHHINGDRTDNRTCNLQLLCPNCHSTTDNYKGRNRTIGTKIVSDEILLEAIQSTKNIRRALLKVGLAPKGANYERAKKLKNAPVAQLVEAIDLKSIQYRFESDQEH